MVSNDFACGYILEIYASAEGKNEESKKKFFFVQMMRRWYPWLGEYSLKMRIIWLIR